MNPIAKRFSDASRLYDVHANVQQQVAHVFTQWIAQAWHSDSKPKTVLDLGCGTGYFTRCLQGAFPDAELMACDWAPEMLETAKHHSRHVSFFLGDAANFIAPVNADLIASSFCMQWLENIAASLEHHLQHCKRLAVAMPCDRSFSLWKQAHHALGYTNGLHPLPNADALRNTLRGWQAAGRITHWREKTLTFTELHTDGLAFARNLKAIGAATPKPGHNPVNLRKLVKRLPSPLTVNYEVLFLEVQA